MKGNFFPLWIHILYVLYIFIWNVDTKELSVICDFGEPDIVPHMLRLLFFSRVLLYFLLTHWGDYNFYCLEFSFFFFVLLFVFLYFSLHLYEHIERRVLAADLDKRSDFSFICFSLLNKLIKNCDMSNNIFVFINIFSSHNLITRFIVLCSMMGNVTQIFFLCLLK